MDTPWNVRLAQNASPRSGRAFPGSAPFSLLPRAVGLSGGGSGSTCAFSPRASLSILLPCPPLCSLVPLLVPLRVPRHPQCHLRHHGRWWFRVHAPLLRLPLLASLVTPPAPPRRRREYECQHQRKMTLRGRFRTMTQTQRACASSSQAARVDSDVRSLANSLQTGTPSFSRHARRSPPQKPRSKSLRKLASCLTTNRAESRTASRATSRAPSPSPR